MRRVRGAGTTGKIGVTGRGLKHVWARHEIDEVPERMPRSWRVARKRRNCQRDGETAREVERRRSGGLPETTAERGEVTPEKLATHLTPGGFPVSGGQ